MPSQPAWPSRQSSQASKLSQAKPNPLGCRPGLWLYWPLQPLPPLCPPSQTKQQYTSHVKAVAVEAADRELRIQGHTPVYCTDETQYSLLLHAAMSMDFQEPARDAVDKLVLACVDLKFMDRMEQLDYMPFDPMSKRTQGTVIDTSGEINKGSKFKTSKGAPEAILELIQRSGGCDPNLASKIKTDVTDLGKRGIRAIAVARTASLGVTEQDDVWNVLGLLTFLDPTDKKALQAWGYRALRHELVTI